MTRPIIPTGAHPSVCVASGAALQIAKKYLGKGNRILDVGCGTGEFIRQLQKTGSDFAVEGIEGFKYNETIRPVNLGYEPLPFMDRSFYGVTAWEVFEHLENPYQVMREIKRILVPGGHLLFSVPNPAHIESRVLMLKKGALARWSETNDHITILTEEIVKKTFGREFTLEEIRYAMPTLASRRGRVIGKINRSLPANKLFGLFTLYALQKNSE